MQDTRPSMALLESDDLQLCRNYTVYVTDDNNEEVNRLAKDGKIVFKGQTVEEAAEKAELDSKTIAADRALQRVLQSGSRRGLRQKDGRSDRAREEADLHLRDDLQRQEHLQRPRDR